MVPSKSQSILLDRLINRDLSNPAHKTNLHLHYSLEYPDTGKSFLDFDREKIRVVAKDPAIHPNLNMDRVMNNKLRWITLGGQYDWTRKLYPDGLPPQFPKDIYDLLHGAFPDMEPQAAIGMSLIRFRCHIRLTLRYAVNLYSPGDTLSLHRDVSEEVDRGLVSISLGCEAIFMIGTTSNDGINSQYQVLRLRSGDAVYMSGVARYAWHGVPKIIANTCPKDLENWPGESHPAWTGYMKNKRVNLNVRQMFDTSNCV